MKLDIKNIYADLKKIPKYAFILLTEISLKDWYLILKHVKFRYLRRALAGRTKRCSVRIELRSSNFHEILFLPEVRSYQKERIDEELYLWEVHGKNYYATLIQFESFFFEYLSGVFTDIYAFNWDQKVVLDIGGFIGDSALYFLEKGAKHCVICEPLTENVKALMFNLHNYKEKITVIKKALASSESPITLCSSSPKGSANFGQMTGSHQMCCEGTVISTLLQLARFDVVKVDCEGAEECLLYAEEKILQSVPYWIIETHSLEIDGNILNKFQKSGFEKTKKFAMTSTVHVVHFQMK